MPNRCRIVCLLPGANGTTEYDATLAVLSLPLASIGDLTDGGAAARRLAAWISNGDDRHPPLEAARIAESVCRHFGIEPDMADGSVPGARPRHFACHARGQPGRPARKRAAARAVRRLVR